MIEEDRFGDHRSKLDKDCSVGPDEMCLRVLKKLVNVIARPLTFSSLAGCGYQRRFPGDWNKANVSSCRKEEDPEHDRLVSLTSVSRKVMEQIL